MSEINMLPTYKIGIGELVDGLICNIPKYCRSNKNQKCDKYYQSIFEKNEGLYDCPYGFNTYLVKRKEFIEIFTGLRVSQLYNLKKLKNKIDKNDKNILLKMDELQHYINMQIKITDLYYDYKYLRDFVDNMIHDIRKFNAHIITKSDLISNKAQSKKSTTNKIIVNNSRNIWAMSSLISTRLDGYNALYNLNPLITGGPLEFNFHSSFFKFKKCLTDECIKKEVIIVLDSNGPCQDINAYDIIDLIPYLVLDNALKYSLSKEKIVVILEDQMDYQNIIIRSIGPKLTKEENVKIFLRGYRGKNVEKLNVEGSGIGLYILKEICRIHNIQVVAYSDSNTYKTVDGIDYSIFSIELKIDKIENNKTVDYYKQVT